MISTDLLLRFEVWITAGLLLIVLDMLFGLEFFALSFGIGAVITGVALLGAGLAPLPFYDNWQAVLLMFGVLSVLVLVPLRSWLNKRLREGGEDINKY